METQIGLIAKGQADKDAVVAHTLQQFRQKFLFFVAKVARMDALFEASFSPLASSGVGFLLIVGMAGRLVMMVVIMISRKELFMFSTRIMAGAVHIYVNIVYKINTYVYNRLYHTFYVTQFRVSSSFETRSSKGTS